MTNHLFDVVAINMGVFDNIWISDMDTGDMVLCMPILIYLVFVGTLFETMVCNPLLALSYVLLHGV